jgi:hypothetical protein
MNSIGSAVAVRTAVAGHAGVARAPQVRLSVARAGDAHRAPWETPISARSVFCERLRRPLTDADRRAVATRLDLVGPERLADVVLDLDGDALAACLADPNAA